MIEIILKYLFAITVAAVGASSTPPVIPVTAEVRHIDGCVMHDLEAKIVIDSSRPNMIDATIVESYELILEEGDEVTLEYQSRVGLNPTFHFGSDEQFELLGKSIMGEFTYPSDKLAGSTKPFAKEGLTFEHDEMHSRWIVKKAPSPITLTILPTGMIPSETSVITIQAKICPAVTVKYVRPIPPQPVVQVFPDQSLDETCMTHKLLATIVEKREKSPDGKVYNVLDFKPSVAVELLEGDRFYLDYESVAGVEPIFQWTSFESFEVRNLYVFGGSATWRSDIYADDDETSTELIRIERGQTGGTYYVTSAPKMVKLKLHPQLTTRAKSALQLRGSVMVCR